MSFLRRAIQRGLSEAVEKVVGNAVQKAVEPTATRLANEAAESIDRAAGQAQAEVKTQSSSLEGAFGNLQRSLETYATQATKDLKVCPGCGKPAQADRKFCDACGTALPEITLGQGALCSACGTQNSVGTRFCSACGNKLPATLAEEAEQQTRAEAVLARWDTELAAYPKWSCGGTPVDIEAIGPGEYIFTVDFHGNHAQAAQAVSQYLALARQRGFRPAGMYPSEHNLYARVNGICYYMDTEHAFDGDSDCPTIGFAVREPAGGFDYVKPEPKKKASFFDLFK